MPPPFKPIKPTPRRAAKPPQRSKPLLPPALMDKLPAWRATADEADPKASVKWFLPGTNWTWYIVEYDGEDTCFGLVAGLEVEAGYFSLSEIESLHSPVMGLLVERDTHFLPTRLSVLRNHHQQRAEAEAIPPASLRQEP